MTTLAEWSARWNIPPAAVEELTQLIKNESPEQPHGQPADNEKYIQQAVRLEASQKGCRLWRNNSGVAFNKNGQPVRFGLGNESAKLNAEFKSADLIGIRPVIVRPEHVGRVFGVFLAREVKHGFWKFRGTKREKAQQNFLELVISLGGDAGFTTGPGTI